MFSLSAQQPPQVQRPEQYVTLVVRPWGVEPPTITIRPGRTEIRIVNRSGLETVTYRLDRPGAARLRELVTERGRALTKDQTPFTPGKHTITFAESPRWTVDVEVR